MLIKDCFETTAHRELDQWPALQPMMVYTCTFNDGHSHRVLHPAMAARWQHDPGIKNRVRSFFNTAEPAKRPNTSLGYLDYYPNNRLFHARVFPDQIETAFHPSYAGIAQRFVLLHETGHALLDSDENDGIPSIKEEHRADAYAAIAILSDQIEQAPEFLRDEVAPYRARDFIFNGNNCARAGINYTTSMLGAVVAAHHSRQPFKLYNRESVFKGAIAYAKSFRPTREDMQATLDEYEPLRHVSLRTSTPDTLSRAFYDLGHRAIRTQNPHALFAAATAMLPMLRDGRPLYIEGHHIHLPVKIAQNLRGAFIHAAKRIGERRVERMLEKSAFTGQHSDVKQHRDRAQTTSKMKSMA